MARELFEKLSHSQEKSYEITKIFEDLGQISWFFF
jgi:hypothetical protein